MNSFLKGIVVFLISIQLISCAKEFQNPYDPAAPPYILMPNTFRLDTLGNNTLRLRWNQEEKHIDGFVVKKNTNGVSNKFLLPRFSSQFTDFNIAEPKIKDTCPKIKFKVMARVISSTARMSLITKLVL